MERLKHVVQINILLGAWLIVARFILGYSGSTVEVGSDIAIGALLIGCSWWILAAMPGQVGASFLQLVAGLWLITAPFYFHYEKLSGAYTNDILAGILVVMVGATASWMLAASRRRPA